VASREKNPSVAFLEPYAKWRASRLGRITDALEEELILEVAGDVAGRRMLDVGGGDGKLVQLFARKQAQVTIMDMDSRMLDAVRHRFADAGLPVETVEGDAARLPFPDNSFDIVTVVTVLCFVEDAGQAVAEMARVLRPGGVLLLGELNRYSLWAAWRRLRGWLGSATWRSVHFRTPAGLKKLVVRAGLRVTVLRAAVFYPPFGWAAALSRSVDLKIGRHLSFGGAFLVLEASKP